MQEGAGSKFAVYTPVSRRRFPAVSVLFLVFPPAFFQGSAGPTKVAAERTLARVLTLDKGIEPALAWVPSGGPLARTIMQVGGAE